jgi:hypothetical protein
MAKLIKPQEHLTRYQALLQDRSEWETEWKDVSEFLLPGRGIYQLYTKPIKRTLTNRKIINPIGREALDVMVTGVHNGLTSAKRDWMDLKWGNWQNPQVADNRQLVELLREIKNVLKTAFHLSHFYQKIPAFYLEYLGYGNGCLYMGSDADYFRFEVLTAGEYAIDLNHKGEVDTLYRVMYMTPRNMIKKFGKGKCSENVIRMADNKNVHYIPVMQVVYADDKLRVGNFRSVYFEITSSGNLRATDQFLKKGFFEEFPFLFSQYEIIGSDKYGIGPGARSLPHVKRLQEMEKAYLMSAHKAVNPPLNVPARLKEQVKTMPGAINYYNDPNMTIQPMYNVKIDYSGLSMAIERAEERIKKIFFNDIFLTTARNPNATPLKATEANIREEEKMERLGLVVERLQEQLLTPLVERGINILYRKNLLPEMPPELLNLTGGLHVEFISPLALAQKRVGIDSINMFLGFIANAAQFDPTMVDKVNGDSIVDEYHDMSGAPITILRSDAEVQQIREQRMAKEQEDRQKAEAMMEAKMQAEMMGQQAQTAKTLSEAGVNVNEGLGLQ